MYTFIYFAKKFLYLTTKKLQLPVALLQSLQNIKGFTQKTFIAVHTSGEQITSIRKNPGKPFDLTIPNSKVDWCANGFYLDSRPSFTTDPLFHAGTYYVQEASSMFLEQVLHQTMDLTNPVKVLDLCAAPGGKSTLIQSLISDKSILVSNEVIKTRVNVLAENITKWGAVNVVVTNNDPKDFKKLPNYFDVIVVDAPCSGSGLFRKDANAITEWSENNVALCSQRQQRILADVYNSLKNDGVLIYSTCSYSKQEDEDVLDWLVEELGFGTLQLKLNSKWGIVETMSEKNGAYGYRFYPDKVKGEGFFIAALKKTEIDNVTNKPQRNKAELISSKEEEVIRKYINNEMNLSFIKLNDELIALPYEMALDLPMLQSLYIKKAGIKLGSIIRNELIPHHELALGSIISKDVVSVEVDKEMALQYLRKQEISLITDKKGWVLITFQHQPLGWVKILPNRINNYYPKEWRILNK